MISNKSLNNIVNKTFKTFLNESQESDSQKLSIRLIMNKLGWEKERANHFVRVDLREKFPSLRDKKIAKFTLGVTRMYLNGELDNENTQNKMNATLKLMAAHLDDYDKDINGLSAQEIISRFESVRKNNLDKDREDNSNIEYNNENLYKIVKINSFDEAKEYCQYLLPSDKWCITYMKNMWDSYTRKGLNQVYFCLKNGFENIQPQSGENCPLDEYGLSMISVIVDDEGNLCHCTSRWNHSNKGNDSIMKTTEISKLINANFYDVFKPNTMIQEQSNEILNQLKQGVDINKIFNNITTVTNGFNIVTYNFKCNDNNVERFNILNTENQPILKSWVDGVDTYDPQNKWFIVGNGNREWYEGEVWMVDLDGNIVHDFTFGGVDDSCYREEDGKTIYSVVDYSEDDNNYYLFTPEKYTGPFMSINNLEGFKNGKFIVVRSWDDGSGGSKCNLINDKGELKFNEWYNDIYRYESLFVINNSGKNKLVNSNGELIYNDWIDAFLILYFDDATPYILLYNDGRFNYADYQSGKLLLPDWLDREMLHITGNLKVNINGVEYYINSTNCKLKKCVSMKNENKKQRKKTIIISEEQIKKVRQGLIAYEENKPDYEIGYEKPTDMSAYAHVTNRQLVNEDNTEYITLYHGLRDYNLLYVLSNHIIEPHIPSERGPKEIWLSNNPYGYSCILSIKVPTTEIGEAGEKKRFSIMNNRDYTTQEPIDLNDYEWKLEKCCGVTLTDEKIERWKKIYYSNDKESIKIIKVLMDDFGDLWYTAILPLIEGDETLNESKTFKHILNEENGSQKRKCVENITNNTPYMIRNLLDKRLDELPYYFQEYFQQLPTLYNSVLNNQNGCNKLIDFLRLNLYSQFAIGRKGTLVYYIPGISRIACEDLRFYAFDESIRGGDILKFGKLLKLFKYKTDFMFEGNPLDPDFNGMHYEELMDMYKDKMMSHNQEMHQKLDDGENELSTEQYYDIYAIPDYVRQSYGQKGGMLVPTEEGMNMLRELGEYCDWCVCGDAAQAEYAQYLSNGGKMYVCAKRGFEDIPKEPGENCPLDEYGLSLINVIIGDDGMPDNITTRWNHEYGGENHSDLWYASQLQKILNVNFRQVFKPRSNEELQQLNLSENKQIIETVEPDDVDLSSFELKDELNPKFWKNDKLDSRIRLKLLDLADNFVDGLKIKDLEVSDITMTGSLAGYTWNDEFSDIDLHIIIDFSKINKDKEFLTDYFKAKKDEWNQKHENLSIFGFPVEVYVQDINEKHVSNSVYSLEENEWVTKPNKSKLKKEKFDEDNVQEIVAEYMNKIDELQEELDSAKIETDLEDIYKRATNLFDEIKEIRNNSMKQQDANEMSDGNIIFKTLRRNEYIEKLLKIRDNSYNKSNSLS